MALVFAVGCTAGVVQGLLNGEQIGGGFFVLLVGSIFCLAIWLLCMVQATSLTVDEECIQTSACWGKIKRSLKWSDVQSAEYIHFPGAKGSNKPPSGYYLNQCGVVNKNWWMPGRIGFTEDLVGYADLEQLVLRKSAEFGFPVIPAR